METTINNNLIYLRIIKLIKPGLTLITMFSKNNKQPQLLHHVQRVKRFRNPRLTLITMFSKNNKRPQHLRHVQGENRLINKYLRANDFYKLDNHFQLRLSRKMST